jgi:hypothetical protein
VNNLRDPISKNSSQKWAGGVAQGVGPEFKPQYCKKKKKKSSSGILLRYRRLSVYATIYEHGIPTLNSPKS